MFGNANVDDDPKVLVALLVPAGLLFLALTAGAVLVVRDTIRRRGNWGLNFKNPTCPLCGQPPSAVRVPKNMRQALWGGTTCGNCGLEYDKWGRAINEADLERRREELDNDPYARPWPGRSE
jgi:hypothetical protein